MPTQRIYKCLDKFSFEENNGYSLVPLRMEDKYLIMQWRNEQLYHLRQPASLTQIEQDLYFNTTVAQLFEQEQPDQLLFSYLDPNQVCIGYGGLVHINWRDQHAEISFIMATEIEKNRFSIHWKRYLSLIEPLAFTALKFHKIFTYAFDLRPHLYVVLEENGWVREAVLKDHFLNKNHYLDVVIHAKINELTDH